MKITDLRPALRDKERVNVYVEGEYSFSLDIAQVVELAVKVGREISEAELAELKAASDFGKLYQRTLEWALTRPRSVQETSDYLRRVKMKRASENRMREANQKKSPEEREKYQLRTKILPEISDGNIDMVMQRLVERGYVDDEKFAIYYIENRFTKKGVSKRRLEMELRNKGVSEDVIAEAFNKSTRDEAAEIRKIIAKKAKRYDAEKLIQYLIRQGFDYQLSQSLVREMDSQNWE